MQDLPVICAGLALFYALLSLTHYWLAPANAQTAIDLRASASAEIRDVLRSTHRNRVCIQLAFYAGIRIRRGIQREGRKVHDSLAGYIAVHSGIEFSSGRDAGNGRAFSYPTAGRGTRLHPTHFYGPGLEYDLQLLFFAEKYSARNARGSRDLSLELVAEIYADGTAICGHWPGLEFDDVGGGRLVFSNGLRNVCFGESRFAPSGTRFVSANGGQCGQHATPSLGDLG